MRCTTQNCRTNYYFINPKDGKLAEDNLGLRIAKRYTFTKKTEFETDLMEVG